MSVMKTIGMLLVPMLCIATAARAQDAPKVGLTMGYPTSVGVLWQIADRVAVRPELSLSHVSGDTSGPDVTIPTPLSSDSTNSLGAGVSALVYLGPRDPFRTYISPRFSYARTSTSAASGTSTSDSTVSAYQVTGSFGAQYTLGRRFGIFGELGVGYTRTSTDITSVVTITSGTVVNGVLSQITRTQPLASGSHSNTVATRSGVGVIFFF